MPTSVMIRHVHQDNEAPSASSLPKENVPNPPPEADSSSSSSSSLHRLLNTKALSVSLIQKSGSSYRLSFMTRSSRLLEDEIKAAKQALGIVLYPHIKTTYYEADPASFLKDNNKNASNDDLIKTVVRPLWLACYKEVSALEQKIAAAQDELKTVQDKLALVSVLLASPCKKEQQKMPAHKVEQWKLSWRQTQLQAQIQDWKTRMVQHQDDFGVEMYNQLQQRQQPLSQLDHVDDTFLLDAIAKCRATIQGIVLRHQQKTQDAGSKVLNLQDTNNNNNSRPNVVALPTAKVVTTTTCSNKQDGEEESVTEATETEEEEYEEVET